MDTNQKKNLLFIEDPKSAFKTNIALLEELFNKVDKVSYYDEALHLFDTNTYDIVLYDISMHPEKIRFIKQIQKKKSMQPIFTLLLDTAEDLAFNLSQLGVNVVVIEPSQFDEALENIATFNPQTGDTN
ncbi:MAG TPA: response regulator transcription factor [Sulfurimonas sp.]|nr:response regulator transcription factor [Sulfurimonas sp.]HIM74913.1 response regulator transcription factor [Campylobacterales bacterium]